MAFNMQRRRSSWFGPQFSMQSFSFGTSSFGGNSPVSRPSSSESRKQSKAQESKTRQSSMQNAATTEPLFQDCYLSLEEEMVHVAPPDLPKWNADYDLAPDETLEELGLSLDNEDDCHIVATFISIINVGKPKVVDISPPASVKDQLSPRSLRSSPGTPERPSIYWRMPSYNSSTSSSSLYSSTDRTSRTESFDSRSSSSISEEPKTPDFGATFPTSIPELHMTPFPRKSSIPERARTLRRQSKNLSTSLSKAFLQKLKEAPPSPPMTTPRIFVEPPSSYEESLSPPTLSKRMSTYDFSAYRSAVPSGLQRRSHIDSGSKR